MKKLIVAAAIVCAAAMSYGASVAWKSNYNYVTSEGNVQTAGTADAGTFVLVYLGNGTADWSNPTVVNEGTVTYASAMGSTTAKAGGTYSFTYGAAGAPVNGDIFGVMFRDEGGNLTKLETTGGSAIEETFTISGMTDTTYAGVMTFATTPYTTNPAPEPTSGLLLLLGVAGLALRRKRA